MWGLSYVAENNPDCNLSYTQWSYSNSTFCSQHESPGFSAIFLTCAELLMLQHNPLFSPHFFLFCKKRHPHPPLSQLHYSFQCVSQPVCVRQMRCSVVRCLSLPLSRTNILYFSNMCHHLCENVFVLFVCFCFFSPEGPVYDLIQREMWTTD